MARRGSSNLLFGFVFIVLVGVVLAGGISKFFVHSNSKQIGALSNIDIQRRLVDYLKTVPTAEGTYENTLNQNPQLLMCESSCKRLDVPCAQDKSCSAAPDASVPNSFEKIPMIELRDSANVIMSSADGGVHLNNDMRPCGKGAGFAPMDDTCQWLLETRAYASKDSTIVFHMRLRHVPLSDEKLKLADQVFEVPTGHPKVFFFKKFLARGRVDSTKEMVVHFATDGSTAVNVQVRCDTHDDKSTQISVVADGCNQSLFGPDRFDSKGGRSSGALKTEGETPCSVRLRIGEKAASCTVEVETKEGRFSQASLEAPMGTARMENLLLTLYSVSPAQKARCDFQNGGLLSGARAKGIVAAELNLCECPKEACFAHDPDKRLTDQDPFRAKREREAVSGPEMWAEARNATGDPGSGLLEIKR